MKAPPSVRAAQAARQVEVLLLGKEARDRFMQDGLAERMLPVNERPLSIHCVISVPADGPLGQAADC